MKYGFIGCGNMAAAIINGALAKGILAKDDILASVKTESSAKKIQETFPQTAVLRCARARTSSPKS